MKGSDSIVSSGLSKSYQDVTALKPIDLDVPKHSSFAFPGPNGATGRARPIRRREVGNHGCTGSCGADWRRVLALRSYTHNRPDITGLDSRNRNRR